MAQTHAARIHLGIGIRNFNFEAIAAASAHTHSQTHARSGDNGQVQRSPRWHPRTEPGSHPHTHSPLTLYLLSTKNCLGCAHVSCMHATAETTDRCTYVHTYYPQRHSSSSHQRGHLHLQPSPRIDILSHSINSRSRLDTPVSCTGALSRKVPGLRTCS